MSDTALAVADEDDALQEQEGLATAFPDDEFADHADDPSFEPEDEFYEGDEVLT